MRIGRVRCLNLVILYQYINKHTQLIGMIWIIDKLQLMSFQLSVSCILIGPTSREKHAELETFNNSHACAIKSLSINTCKYADHMI